MIIFDGMVPKMWNVILPGSLWRHWKMILIIWLVFQVKCLHCKLCWLTRQCGPETSVLSNTCSLDWPFSGGSSHSRLRLIQQPLFIAISVLSRYPVSQVDFYYLMLLSFEFLMVKDQALCSSIPILFAVWRLTSMHPLYSLRLVDAFCKLITSNKSCP